MGQILFELNSGFYSMTLYKKMLTSNPNLKAQKN